jgi:hypothetical protein
MVNVTVPVARVTGAGVFDGDTVAVNVTGCPVTTLAGAVTVVVVTVPGVVALALKGFRASVATLASVPAPATKAIFLNRLPIIVPPRADPASHQRSAECVRDNRRRRPDRL